MAIAFNKLDGVVPSTVYIANAPTQQLVVVFKSRVCILCGSVVFTCACSDDNVPNETANRPAPFVPTGELHLANFDAHQLLGVGSFGEVYRVRR